MRLFYVFTVLVLVTHSHALAEPIRDPSLTKNQKKSRKGKKGFEEKGTWTSFSDFSMSLQN